MRRIVTISREFGSGGRELGKRLADRMGIAYYDNEIVTAIARKSGFSQSYVQGVMEKRIQSYPIHYGRTLSLYALPNNENQTSIFAAQHEILHELAEKEDCVIVGRCADVILEEFKPFNVFVYADMMSKVQRCRLRAPEGEHFSDKELEKKIRQVDSGRAKYRRLFSPVKWGSREAYHLCVNTSGIPVKNLVEAVYDYVQIWFEHRSEKEVKK